MTKRPWVPSLYILLNTAAANLLVNWFFFRDAGCLAAALTILAASQVLLFHLMKISLTPGRAVPLVLLTLTISAGEASIAACRLSPRPLQDESSVFRASVLDITGKRYHREALLAPEHAAPGKTPLILSYCPSSAELHPGDELVVFAGPLQVRHGEAGSFQKQLLRRGIHWTVNLGMDNFTVHAGSSPSLRERTRFSAAAMFDRLLRPSTSALMKAICLNERHCLDKKTIESFRLAGIMHVLSASGLHVGIIAAIPLFLSALFLLPRVPCGLAGLALIVFYLFITGCPVSLLRATLMFGFFLGNSLFSGDKNPFSILFLAAVTILLPYPHELYSPGFQLSFGATGALILFFPSFRGALDFLPSFLRDSVSVTLSVHIAVAPLLLASMGEINYTALAGNLAAIPLITVILVISLASAGLSFIWEGAALFAGSTADTLYSLTDYLIDLLSLFPGHFRPPGEAVPLILLFTCIMGLSALLLPAGKKRLKAAAISLCMLASFLTALISTDTPRQEIKVVSHNGRACCIIKSGRRAVVVGEISREKEAEEVLSALKRFRTTGCSLYIVNPDRRNIRFFSCLLRQTVVDSCFIGKGFRLGRQMSGFLEILERDGIIPVFRDLPVSPDGAAAYKNITEYPINIDSETDIGYIYSSAVRAVESCSLIHPSSGIASMTGTGRAGSVIPEALNPGK